MNDDRIEYDTGDPRADEIFTRLDDLEREVGTLIQRVNLLTTGSRGLAEIAKGLIDEHAKLAVAIACGPAAGELPEDVPQNVRTGRGGEDRPQRGRPRWTPHLHTIHCRDDRCNGGSTCSCPCHQPGYHGELDDLGRPQGGPR